MAKKISLTFSDDCDIKEIEDVIEWLLEKEFNLGWNEETKQYEEATADFEEDEEYWDEELNAWNTMENK